jgi:hypothetical protein
MTAIPDRTIRRTARARASCCNCNLYPGKSLRIRMLSFRGTSVPNRGIGPGQRNRGLNGELSPAAPSGLASRGTAL